MEKGGMDNAPKHCLLPPSSRITHLQHLVHLGGKPIKVLLGQKLALSLGDCTAGFVHQSPRLPLTVHLQRSGGREGGSSP